MNKLVVDMDSDLFRELSIYCAERGATKKVVVQEMIEKCLKEFPRRKAGKL